MALLYFSEFSSRLLLENTKRSARAISKPCWRCGSPSAAEPICIVLLFVQDLATAKILVLAQMFFAGNSWGVITPLLLEVAPMRLRNLAVPSAQVSFTARSVILASELIGLVSDQVGLAHALFLAPLATCLPRPAGYCSDCGRVSGRTRYS
jgi:hypothetical protein